MKENKNRPTIPENIKRILWAKAAGRCEFRGCNKCLYNDEVTQKSRNMSEIAHIISWKSTGPRGSVKDSSRLAIDISNLMLTCPEHNALIDDPQYVDEYPVELLRQMKQEHEERVYWMTGLGQDYSLRVIELVSRIQNQTPTIDEKDEIDALLPNYPREKSIYIDLTNVESIEEAKRQIDKTVDLHIRNSDDKSSYAAFIMAKIPYSCYLGYSIGNKVKVRTFQFFRDSEDWRWKEEQVQHLNVIIPELETCQDDVNLLVNISGRISKDLIPDYPAYVIEAESPSVMFLRNEEQVVEFRLKYRELLDSIRYKHGENVRIHLFVAAPNPITFEVGRSIMKNLDPTIILYDKVSDGIEYKEIMHLHDRLRSED